MRLGIFAKTFVRPTLGETLDAVVARGLDCIQFNFACAGLPSMPDKISSELAVQIGREIKQRRLTVAAVSGTFNMIDPDRAKRRDGLRRLEEIAASCRALGTSLVTVCTGTRDAQDMWKHHPENESPEAWRDLIQSITAAVTLAEKYDIVIGVEPETANVISSAARARRLLDEIKSPRLKLVMDASNLFRPGETARPKDILTEAFDLLGSDIILAHAKDFRDTGKMEYVAPGKGVLPWPEYIRLLRMGGFLGALIMHSLAETEVAESASFLRKTMIDCKRSGAVPVSATFTHDGINFHYQESGRGIPFFFQHGLGGDVTRPFEQIKAPEGFRMIGFDCRGHGQTRPVGPDEKIGLASFADDLRALMDHLGIGRAIVGGTSMGAAVALNFTLRHPGRVCGLILQRPAWLDRPRHENVQVYTFMAQLIRRHGPEKGLEIFKLSPAYQAIFEQAPNAAKSLTAHFLDPRAQENVALLERIPIDAPNRDRAEWRAIHVPTLVLANRQDMIHPFEYGETLAAEIPGAEFHELTPKNVDADQHNADIQRFIENFLLRNF